MTEIKPHLEYTANDRRMAAACYIFFVPSLYCILTARHFTRFVGGHSTQAFLLWVIIFAYWLAVRIFFNIVWGLFGMIGFFFPYLSFLAFFACIAAWIYAVKFGLRAYKGETFVIETVRDFGERYVWKKDRNERTR
jgi:uncharacterized membrane protein